MIDPNELFYPAVDLLRRLIATPSISREENATADLIAAYLQEYGFTPHRQQRLGHSTRLHPGASHCFTEFTPRYRTAGRRVARTSI